MALAFTVVLSIANLCHSAVPREQRLPNFQVTLVNGNTLKSRDLLGKITVIDFWGTWCPPCLKEIPEYNAFYREFKKKGVGFYGLAAESGTMADLRDAANRLKIDYPVAALTDEELDAFGDIPVFPTTWIVNRNGVVEKELVGSGPGKLELLRSTVARLLEGGGQKKKQ
ncbi:MAG TPA: TlpA disulfide reductase family protein [Acidobacteriota bacterium]|nr:TlpA disulfide reductase family protein [Acidobacteriota bacterium]